MTLFHSLLIRAQTESSINDGEPAVLTSASSTEALTRRANEAVASGIFPIEVAFVVLGCLMVTGLLLLMRESRIETRL